MKLVRARPLNYAANWTLLRLSVSHTRHPQTDSTRRRAMASRGGCSTDIVMAGAFACTAVCRRAGRRCIHAQHQHQAGRLHTRRRPAWIVLQCVFEVYDFMGKPPGTQALESGTCPAGPNTASQVFATIMFNTVCAPTHEPWHAAQGGHKSHATREQMTAHGALVG